MLPSVGSAKPLVALLLVLIVASSAFSGTPSMSSIVFAKDSEANEILSSRTHSTVTNREDMLNSMESEESNAIDDAKKQKYRSLRSDAIQSRDTTLSSSNFTQVEAPAPRLTTLQNETQQPQFQQSQSLSPACLTNSVEECPGTLTLSTVYHASFSYDNDRNGQPDGVPVTRHSECSASGPIYATGSFINFRGLWQVSVEAFNSELENQLPSQSGTIDVANPGGFSINGGGIALDANTQRTNIQFAEAIRFGSSVTFPIDPNFPLNTQTCRFEGPFGADAGTQGNFAPVQHSENGDVTSSGQVAYPPTHPFALACGPPSIPEFALGLNCSTTITWNLEIQTTTEACSSSVTSLAANQNDKVGIQQIANCPPIAEAGEDRRVNSGADVELDGTGSFDLDNGPITPLRYTWTPVTQGAPALTGANTPKPTFEAPYVDRETTFEYQLVVNDGANDSPPSRVSITILPLIVEISANRDQINPYAPPATNSQPANAMAQLTARVTNLDGQMVPNEEVRIKACTVPSLTTRDGHEAHDQRADSCQVAAMNPRPRALLNGGPQAVQNNQVMGIIGLTDAQGEIRVSYESPRYVRPTDARVFYVSGQDDIKAQLRGDETPQHDSRFYASLSITTRVLDTANGNAPLQAMPNSQPNNCPAAPNAVYPPNGNYFFQKQGRHACIFYSTLQTNNALIAIAQDFENRQILCTNPVNVLNNPLCRADTDVGNEIPIHINGPPRPLKITALSLTWGGLSDISGNWQPSHSTHNNGRVADINFLNRNGNEMNVINKLLLREVIRDNVNHQTIEPCEGGRNIMAPHGCTRIVNGQVVPFVTDHIHAYFIN